MDNKEKIILKKYDIIYELLLHFFKGDRIRTLVFLHTENELLENKKPINLILLHKFNEVLDFLRFHYRDLPKNFDNHYIIEEYTRKKINQLNWLDDKADQYLCDLYAHTVKNYIWIISKYKERYIVQQIHILKNQTTYLYRRDFETIEECKEYAQNVHEFEIRDSFYNLIDGECILPRYAVCCYKGIKNENI